MRVISKCPILAVGICAVFGRHVWNPEILWLERRRPQFGHKFPW